MTEKSRSRPLELRERALRRGTTVLGDVELLALVIGPGGRTSPLTRAARLLDRMGSLAALPRLSSYEISEHTGLGLHSATRVCAAVELGRRAAAELLSARRDPMGSFAAVERWARPRLSGLDHEEVWLLSLDGRNGLRAARRVAQGGAHGCALSARDVLAPALRDGASAIVLVHNHPSGEPTPSPEDVAMTRAVARAAEVVGVPLLDHVVVARGGAASVFDGSGEDR
jgi:DNA repair protein RadC